MPTKTSTTKKATTKKEVTTKKVVAKAPVKEVKKAAPAKTPAKKAAATKAPAKKAPAKKAVASKELSSLYISTDGKLVKANNFESHISEVYGVEELVWKGKLASGSVVSFITKDKKVIPDVGCYTAKGGPGYTLDGAKAIASFKVENAISIPSASGEQVYNYVSKDSKLVYVGDSKAHTIYVRIYDDVVGEPNDRWVVINVD